MTDLSLSPQSLFGSAKWTAQRLGRSVDWLRQNRDELDRDGFPAPDAITGLWIKADVDAWVTKRRRISDAAMVVEQNHQQEVNLDAL